VVTGMTKILDKRKKSPIRKIKFVSFYCPKVTKTKPENRFSTQTATLATCIWNI